MKAQVKIITREIANELLMKNTENRRVNKNTLEFYKKQMIKGQWKQNGESIIIDTNGVVKDGQHRLMAVKETGVPIVTPLITEVTPDVMDTIDTGRSRSASDVLDMSGFANSAFTASLCKTILKKSLTSKGMHQTHISHTDILDYAEVHKTFLNNICKKAHSISSMQVEKVLTPTMIGYYIYKFGLKESVSVFLKQITGTERIPQTATDYVYKKLYLAKKGEVRLSVVEKEMYIEKAYEYYNQGNPKVKFLKINN